MSYNSEVTDYLIGKNIQYELSGKEAVCVCPECGKKKLSINIETNVYRCFVCGAENPNSPMAKGHLSDLKRYYGDSIRTNSATVTNNALNSIRINDKPDKENKKPKKDFTKFVQKANKSLIKSKEYLEYLEKRGISVDSIEKYNLGLINRNGQNWLVIPSYADGYPQLLKYRKLEPDTCPDTDKYLREPNCPSILFNQDILKNHETVIIAEGELDAITLLQAGYENVVGITVGAGTLSTEWYDLLYLKERIYLCLDPDKAGQTAAKDVWATRLGLGKCYNVMLPTTDEQELKYQDVNDYFLTHTKEDFDKLLQEAKRFEIQGVVSLSEALYELYEYSQSDKQIVYPYPWQNVNKLIGGGQREGQHVVLSGIPGVGKTTMAIQIAHYMAAVHGIPSFVFCMEMLGYELATKVVQQHFDLEYGEINPADALMYEYEIGKLPLYFGYEPKITPEIFYNTVKECRDRHGVKFVIFDNIQRMVRSGENADMARASGVFKDMAMSLKVMSLMLSQPRKTGKKNERPWQEDMRGAGEIIDDADMIMMLFRKREQEEGKPSLSPFTEVLVEKGRFSEGGVTKLYYKGAKATFNTLDGD